MSKTNTSIKLKVGWTNRKRSRLALEKIQRSYKGYFWYFEDKKIFKSTFTLTATNDYIGQGAMGVAINVVYGL